MIAQGRERLRAEWTVLLVAFGGFLGGFGGFFFTLKSQHASNSTSGSDTVVTKVKSLTH